ncbi:ABC transporter ATP-binding protein [candidate division KSB1 bacterium]|nr:ABC transporter ATP-binding protein [candidate division KSB1 bacterium]NIR71155.1 ABC transporter ATP-binding protein [candidate division KSB1 bacterium]NIS23285.1 ABC transporter ATP-binding protein [candidate division KSB1 bacterium]NIT70163.1 ABC transporter ATP-binding protein [candidate division KSB1 bacterium]NIU23815.1 ABC transporter ATP-binding protein [candidate division KSB1 bacterium]
MLAVETFQLTKIFGRRKITALSDLSISVEKGRIYGVLGPNGAGKTTLIKILLGILFPTSGSANILGQPINKVRIKKKIGYLPENHRYPDFLKGGEILDYFARLAGVEKKRRMENKARLLKLVGMEKWEQTKLKKYSKGMLQRLGLAQAMINDPEILFLDEPTDGVDPIGRKEIRDILLHLKDAGKTIFLNSHLLSEVEMICDEVAILDKGKLMRTGTVTELTTPSKTFRFETSRVSKEVIDGIEKYSLQCEPHNGFIQVTVSGQKKLNAIIDHLRSHKVDIKSIIPHKQSLEESFIEILTKDIQS